MTTDPIERLAEVVAARTNREQWHLSSYCDSDSSDGSILSVDVWGNQASWQDIACGDALGSCADEIVTMLLEARNYRRTFVATPLSSALDAIAAKLAALLPEKEFLK